jgi:hypothetical protein
LSLNGQSPLEIRRRVPIRSVVQPLGPNPTATVLLPAGKKGNKRREKREAVEEGRVIRVVTGIVIRASVVASVVVAPPVVAVSVVASAVPVVAAVVAVPVMIVIVPVMGVISGRTGMELAVPGLGGESEREQKEETEFFHKKGSIR